MTKKLIKKSSQLQKSSSKMKIPCPRKVSNSFKSSKQCCMCEKPVFSIKSIYCRECSHFCARMSDERFPPEVREDLKNYVREHRGYYCYYTGMKLDVFDKSNPYFLEFDHIIPGDPRHMVMTSAWLNEEFRCSVI